MKKLAGQLGITLSALTLLVCAPALAQSSRARGYSFLNARVPFERTIQQDMEQKKYAQALSALVDSHSSYLNSVNGYSLFSYLLFKSGMKYYGLETLLKLGNPGSMNLQLRNLWSAAVPAENPLWTLVNANWRVGWSRIFPKASTRIYANSWHSGLKAAIDGKNELALEMFHNLLETGQRWYPPGEIHLNVARVDYQAGRLNEAIREYKKVSPSSDYWIQALEERAWAELRLKRPGRTIGLLQTIMIPGLKSEVGPEPYFLGAYANLKICDYEGALKYLNLFKKRIKPHMDAMEQLANTGLSSKAKQALESLMSGPLLWERVGDKGNLLPYLFDRDATIRALIQYERAVSSDEAVASHLSAQDPQIFRPLSMPAQNFMNLWQTRTDHMNRATAIITQRLRELAFDDLKEIKNVINEFHVLEAEVIERVEVNTKVASGSVPKSKVSSDDILRFPYDGEIWADEVGHYRAHVKGCPGGEKL